MTGIMSAVMTIVYKELDSKYTDDGKWSTVYWIWVTIAFVNMFYSYYWDLYMDWGLIRSKKFYGLRDIIHYPQWFYYYAMVTNLLLRGLWMPVVFISPDGIPFLYSWSWGTLVAVLELYRRWQWAFLRIENE